MNSLFCNGVGLHVLTTERLVLRPFVETDAAQYHALVSDPEILRYTRETGVDSLEQTLEILRSRPLRDYRVHGYGRMACVLRETGRLVGFCGLKKLEDLDGEIDIGYRFLPSVWGLGIASESAAAIYAHGKQSMKLPRIIGLVMPENTASVRVLMKLGMRRERAVRLPSEPQELDFYV